MSPLEKSRLVFLFFIFFLTSSFFCDACESVRVRDAISGFGLHSRIHPDYSAAELANPKRPNLGVAGKKFCNGKEFVGVYEIYPTGIIKIVYSELNDPSLKGIDPNCELMSSPFKEICQTSKNLTEILIALNQKQLNNSQKYVLLKGLYKSGACDSIKKSISDELSRLDSLPYLKPAYFHTDIDVIQAKHSCLEPKEEDYFAKDNRFVRLVMKGETRAFATVHIDQENRIVKFAPIQDLSEIANLPATDGCVSMAREIADVPSGDPTKQAELMEKLNVLRQFEKLPTLPPYNEPSFATDKNLLVSQGNGKASSGPLFTVGMMPCVGVAVLNKNTKKAFLIHADAITDIDKLMRTLVPQVGSGQMEAVIAGGSPDPGSVDTLYRLLNSLKEQNIKVIGYRPNPGIDSLAVDPQTGKFF